MPGGAVVVHSRNGEDDYPTARSFPVKLVRPLLFFALPVATFFLFLGSRGAAYNYYPIPSLAIPDVLLAARRPAPCAEETEVDRWWARPSSRSAWHNMSDDELLWAASFEPRAAPPQRPSRPRKVAFLFLTRGPLPLAPLWERFFHGTGTSGSGRELFSVYIHSTPGYRLDFHPSSPFHRRQIPSKVRRCQTANASSIWMFRPACSHKCHATWRIADGK
jgi:hypothetical protein